MVAVEPCLGDVFELLVLRYLFRRKMAVIIEYRLGFGVLVIKFARRFRAQQKIFMDEGHKSFAEQQRFHVPLKQVFRDVFGDDGLVLPEGVEIAVALLGGDFKTDV